MKLEEVRLLLQERFPKLIWFMNGNTIEGRANYPMLVVQVHKDTYLVKATFTTTMFLAGREIKDSWSAYRLGETNLALYESISLPLIKYVRASLIEGKLKSYRVELLRLIKYELH